jgi:hypothetical protein
MNTSNNIQSLGYKISEDPDQPGMWLWVGPHGDASDISFDSENDAIADAQRHAGGEASSADNWYANLTEGSEVWWNDPDDGISSGYYRISGILLEDDEAISPSTVVELQNEHGSFVEAFVSELSPYNPDRNRNESSTLRLVIEVGYNLNGESIEQMKQQLQRLIQFGVGQGMLTAFSRTDIDHYSVEEVRRPAISEEEIAAYFADQLENGHIDLCKVPDKLARYGLMDPSEFAMEMQERIEMAKCGIDEAQEGKQHA